MTSTMRSRQFLIVGKIVCTFALLIVIFVWTLFMILILPVIMIAIYHGTKGNGSNFRLSMAMIPVGVVAIIIFRMWSPARYDPKIVENTFTDVLVNGVKHIRSRGHD